jgi:hypothetical protein
MPTHELASKSGTPASMKVGTSGSDGARRSEETATGWSLPAVTCV